MLNEKHKCIGGCGKDISLFKDFCSKDCKKKFLKKYPQIKENDTNPLSTSIKETIKIHNTRTKNSKDRFETPMYIVRLLERFLSRYFKIKDFKITLDPCASPNNAKCILFYIKEIDGLSFSWEGHKVFVNPPYNNKVEWLEKAYLEGLKENTIVVVLIPVATSTEYFRKLCWKAKLILFVQGRIQFLLDGKPIIDKNGKKTGNNLDSMVLIFDGDNPERPDFDLFYHKTSDLIIQESCIESYL